MIKVSITFFMSIMFSVTLLAQVPKSYSNMKINSEGKLTLNMQGKIITEQYDDTAEVLENLIGNPIGTEKGIAFDFKKAVKKGVIYYGFIPYHDMNYPIPVYFKKKAKIKEGKAEVNISKMKGKYDMINWVEKGKGALGYRVQNNKGGLLYEGVLIFEYNNGFKVGNVLIEGPSVSNLKTNSVVLRIRTLKESEIVVEVDGRKLKSEAILHEIKIDNLKADKKYNYTVIINGVEQSYNFKTAPKSSKKVEFKFAYASDSRGGNGGGERNFGGTNFYMARRVAAFAGKENVAFMQYTGDMINGYNSNKGAQKMEYSNWKRAVEPWAHYFPIYTAIGNHEALSHWFFANEKEKWPFGIDRFPFETESMEAIFADEFTHPENGPKSEDGASYDPSSKTIDFPSYNENVYYYTYGNTAMIVLNTHYWYAYRLPKYPETSGCPHGYIMENQIKWFKETLNMFEKDKDIKHVFVTHHTPAFPNGGHVGDAMYYNGKNDVRAIVAGKPLEFGIIEVRDKMLDLMVNKSTKVKALLTGDEHNYAKMEVGPNTNIYPENWKGKKLKLKRTIYQINNGAAGAPYYAQEQTPWSNKVSGFSTQNAIVVFNVEGKIVKVKVSNPDTFDEVDSFELK